MDPILLWNTSKDFYTTLKIDQLEKPKMVTWLIGLVEFQRRVKFNSKMFGLAPTKYFEKGKMVLCLPHESFNEAVSVADGATYPR